ncbi:DUF4132 domain-containing protein [Pseudomonas sp. IT-347P]|uniref:hypothetical protein n=1 Tax=Pseudomonas sp. IT-347P TaxID=3026458 RepID=UPI0039E01F99
MAAVTPVKLFKSCSDAYRQQQYKLMLDTQEREEVLEQLKDGLAEQGTDTVYSWQGYTVDVQESSSLHDVYNPGRVLWNMLINTAQVESELRRHRAINSTELARVNAAGIIEVFRAATAQWQQVDVDNIVRASNTFKRLQIVGEVAAEAGGYIYDTDYVNIDQWLRFHGLSIPENQAQTKNLIAYLEFDPQAGELSNYWEQLDADDPSLVALSPDHCRAVRAATAKLLGAGAKLLEVLDRKTGRVPVTADNVDEWIRGVVDHSYSQSLAEQYLQTLQWFGAQPGEQVSPRDAAQLLVTAMLLDSCPLIGTPQPRKNIGGFELYSPSHLGSHPSRVREQLEAFLRGRQWCPFNLGSVAAHLLLAGIAPEFLVKSIPATLIIGSVDWMTFCHAVALVEAAKKGAVCRLTYEQVMAYAALDPLSDAHVELRNLSFIDPMIEWALCNEIVTVAQLTQNEKATTERAIEAFQAYADNFSPRFGQLPDRRQIARLAVQDAAPLCDFLDDKILNQHPGLWSSVTTASMIDLHMSGDLAGGEWDRAAIFPDNVYSSTPSLHAGVTNYKRPGRYDPTVISIHQEFPRLRRLRPNDEEFHRQLRAYLSNLNNSLVATVKHAISGLPQDDLQAFLVGKVTFFTFRDSAIDTHESRGGPIVFSTEYETREGKDGATGRFGLVMCVSSGSRLITYELFTLRGELIRNDELGSQLLRKGLFDAPARLDFSGNMKGQESPVAKDVFNISFSKYSRNELSDSGSENDKAIAEKLGELPAAGSPAPLQRSTYKNFTHPQLSRLAGFIIEHHSIIKFHELVEAATLPTELELERAKGKKIATYIVDLVVPFKKCIEDLTSGDSNRVVDGIYGCMMDIIALGGAFVGAGAKALSISAKAISAANKAARVAKLVVVTSVSVFNPVDGVHTALYGVGKLVHKGGLRFGKQTLELLAVAKSNLNRVHGTSEIKRLIRKADDVYAGQGTWRPNDSLAETFTVLAARKNSHWFALDRVGKPWGPRLNNFKPVAPARLPRSLKTLPVSYTRMVIEQSLPRARTKIENAISLLTRKDFSAERNALFRILLGTTPGAAANKIVDYLRLIRADFAGVSLSNCILDPFKDTNHIAAFDLDAYKVWKTDLQQANAPFIEVNTANLNRRFVESRFNHDVVADDLIHELFHGSTQHGDVVYAQDAGLDAGGGVNLDVTALLNLALGRLPLAGDDSGFHPASKTLENADSLTVFTSLLSQMSSEKETFDRNLQVLGAAVDNSGGRAISGPVLINLNK